MNEQIEFLVFDYLSSWLTLWPTVLLFIVVGIKCLGLGADWLVDGAANLGFRFGMTATTIGLTIVAFGTSAPELVVSVMTATQGRPAICLGNVIGSNIANTTLILGATAIVFPIKLNKVSTHFDGPICLGAIVLVFVLAVLGDFTLSRLDGMILLGVFVAWMVWMNRSTSRKKAEIQAAPIDSEDDEEVVFARRSSMADLGMILIGLLGLVGGAKLLVAGAVKTAYALGVSDIVVGLTVVAGGTSLPELAVCMAAALKKQSEITVGNVLGSNIFNALLILGACLLITPIHFDISSRDLASDWGTLFFDLPFTIMICALLIPLMIHKGTLTRAKGIMLVGAYLFYIVALVIRNS